MKKNLLSIVFLSLALTSFGQIVITNDDIAPAGTTVFMAYDTIPSAEIVPGDAGADKTWDFSSVVTHDVDTIDLVLPASTPYPGEFPEANFAVALSNDSLFVYMARSDDKLSRTGMAIVLPEDDPMFWHIDPEDILLDFPVSYENSYTENYVIDYIIPSPEPGADSIRVKNDIDKETEIDAWGTLIIPMGTFDVLRQRVEEIETDSIFAKIFGSWMFISATVDTSINYTWWTDDVNVGFSLVSIDVVPATGDVDGSVSFMNSFPVGVSEKQMVENKTYPNPVSDVLQIEFTEAQTGELTLYNQVGQTVLIQTVSQQKQISLGLSSLPKGMYIFQLRNVMGEVISVGKVIKK